MKNLIAIMTIIIAQDARLVVRFLRCVPWLTLLCVGCGLAVAVSFDTHGMPTLSWVAGGLAFLNWVLAMFTFERNLNQEFASR